MVKNKLPLNDFIKYSKESGYTPFDKESCSKKWYETVGRNDKKAGGFPMLKRWFEEDGLDWKKLFPADTSKDLLDAKLLFANFDIQVMSQVFAKRYPDKYIYQAQTKQWYSLRPSGLWSKTDYADGIYNDLSTDLKSLLSLLKPKDVKDRNKEQEKTFKCIMKEIQKMCEVIPSRVRNCIPYLTELYTDRKNIEFDSKWNLFGFLDVVIDLETHIIRPYQPDDYVTLTTGYEYGKPTQEQITTLKTLFSQIIPNEDERRLFLILCATGLEGRTLEHFMKLWGRGRNGKGLSVDLMALTLGAYAYKLSNLALTRPIKEGNNPEMANCERKRFLYSQESSSCPFDNSTVKEITGGSSLNTRLNHSNRTEIPICPSTFVETNNKFTPWKEPPQKAEIERFIEIHFTSTFTEHKDEIDPENHVYECNILYKNNEWRKLHRLAMFHLLLEHHKLYRDASYKLNMPEFIRQRSLNELALSWEPLKWVKDNYNFVNTEKISKEQAKKNWGHIQDKIKLQDVFAHFQESDYFKALEKNEKKLVSRVKFIEAVENCAIFKHNCVRFEKGEKTKRQDGSFENILGVWLINLRSNNFDDE